MTVYPLDLGQPYTIQLVQGQRYSLFVQYVDTDGVVVNMTSKTSAMQVRDQDDELLASITQINSADGIITHSSTGLTFTLEPEATARFEKSRLNYQLWFYPDSIALLRGLIDVEPAVVHA